MDTDEIIEVTDDEDYQYVSEPEEPYVEEIGSDHSSDDEEDISELGNIDTSPVSMWINRNGGPMSKPKYSLH
jgi:hypothetical protein